MPKKKEKSIALRELTVQNFKALDNLTIKFPAPRMKEDPDIIILGSKNGLGKTSVLEACALLFLAVTAGVRAFSRLERIEAAIDFYNLLVRAGAEKTVISGVFFINNKANHVQLSFTKKGNIKIKGDTAPLSDFIDIPVSKQREMARRFFLMLAGLTADPLLYPRLMYFHSYRKVQEGNPELGMMLEETQFQRRPRYRGTYDIPISAFKLEILRSMMSQAKLFETLDFDESTSVLEKLNELVTRYADGIIEKLRPLPDNTVEFRITPNDGGESFTIDGLSSGQKEIISTLFLIWKYSRNQPSIVLIDEPELHLNVEWHRDFVHQIHSIAPKNQYIFATHSTEIFSSVEEDRRLILEGVGV